MSAARRVLAILVAVAALSLTTAPARAEALITAPARAEADNGCALTGDGDVYCWGGSAPVRVRVTGRVVQLAASGDSTCALTEPGEVYCWGPEAPAPASGADPLLLVTLGILLVAGGATLVVVSRRQESARPAEKRP